MSIETYVYAILGVHCKDVCTNTLLRQRGCDHPESAAKFCAVCGKKIWVKTNTQQCLSDKLGHLQLWYGDPDTGEVDENAISMIYSPMCGPNDFVVGKVLENVFADEGSATLFSVLTDLEWATVYEQTKAELEPLGLWDEKKFGYMLYAISM